MQSFDIVASFFRLFSIAYTYIVAYWYIKYRRQAVIQVISISTLFPAANMIFSMKPPSDCCSHRDHVSLCFTPPTQVWDKNISISWIYWEWSGWWPERVLWWSGMAMDRSHWWQGKAWIGGTAKLGPLTMSLMSQSIWRYHQIDKCYQSQALPMDRAIHLSTRGRSRGNFERYTWFWLPS